MAKKAELFHDDASKAKILDESDPVSIKNLGKAVIGFDDKIWKSEAPKIMKTGLEAKFQQNEDLAMTLKDTGDKQIIEASEDLFWGAGVSLWSEHLFDPNYWSGENVLGHTLMTIREQLK